MDRSFKTKNMSISLLNKRIIELMPRELQFVPRPEFFASPDTGTDMTGLREYDTNSGGGSYVKSLLRMEMERTMNYTTDRCIRDLELYLPLLKDFDASAAALKKAMPQLMDSEWGVAQTTCALGITDPTHSFLEEFGAYSLSRDSEVEYSGALVPYLKRHIQKNKTEMKSYRDIQASYPRGKNSGVPVIVSGGDRLLNDVIMFHNMLLGSTIARPLIDNKVSDDQFIMQLEAMINMIENEYGDLIFLGFDRYQHNAKKIPLRVGGQLMASTNFQMRRRLINATVKCIAMANKPLVKALTEFDLSTPIFTQDRAAINDRLRRAISRGHRVVAYDQSRFDLRHGGDKLRRGNEIFAQMGSLLTGLPYGKLKALTDLESRLPALLLHNNSAYLGGGTDALKSGESGTSRKGCYMNAEDDMTITMLSKGLSREGVVDYYLQYEPSIILSDDIIKIFPTADDAEKYTRAAIDQGERMGISYEIEEPTKFLGSYFDDKDLRHPWKSSAMSALQKVYFPERFKTPAAIPLSLHAKMTGILSSYPNANRQEIYKVFFDAYRNIGSKHDRMSQSHKDIIKLLPASYREFEVLTTDMLKDPEKYGLTNDFSAIDEILNIYGHGLEGDVSFDRIGLGELSELQDAGSVEHTMKQDDVLSGLEEILSSGNVTNVKKNVRAGVYNDLLAGYNDVFNSKLEPLGQLRGLLTNLNSRASELGLRFNQGSYAFSFRFSKGREKRAMEKRIVELVPKTEGPDVEDVA